MPETIVEFSHGCERSQFVTDLLPLSPRVTDNVTDDLEKNLGKTVFVTVSPINTPGRGVPPIVLVLVLLLVLDSLSEISPLSVSSPA